MYKWGLLTVASLLLIGCGGGASSSEDDSSVVDVPTVSTSDESGWSRQSYEENSSVNLLNPDRGFYDASYHLEASKSYNMFDSPKEKGYKLVYGVLSLEDYAFTEILPQTLLDTLGKNLSDAQANGIKIIFRIRYRPDSSGKDPQKSIILGHLQQLSSVMSEHRSAISVVQAGTLGAWGEWHTFTGEFDDESDEAYRENRLEVLKGLLALFPEHFVQIRTPMHKELLLGDVEEYKEVGTAGEITPEIAYTSDIRARVGHHNDCFLSTSTDMGTYASDNIAFWKSYVENDSKYTPVGGETCGIGEDEDAERSSCTTALLEMKQLHYSYMNDDYHPDVIEKWKTQGCYTTIQENLGYRLVATSLAWLEESTQLSVDLTLENRGFASPYQNYPVSYILYNEQNRYTFPLSLDTRTLYAGESKALRASLPLEGVKSGQYCLGLSIGEEGSLVHLSNEALWSSSQESNTLLCGIEVAP